MLSKVEVRAAAEKNDTWGAPPLEGELPRPVPATVGRIDLMKTCFVIAPIGDPGSDTRKRSDLILKYVVAPAAEQCGYTALRADQISEPGLITSQVIQHVIDDPLVIADLTERNPNVFYELAIRHALRKPLVQIIKAGEQIPFDVAGTRTIPVDHRDLESVEEAKREIARQIDVVLKKPQDMETPISVAVELQILRQSDNPEQRSLAELVSAIADIKNDILSLQKNLGESDLSKVRLEEMFYRTERLYLIQRDVVARFEEVLKRFDMRESSDRPALDVQANDGRIRESEHVNRVAELLRRESAQLRPKTKP